MAGGGAAAYGMERSLSRNFGLPAAIHSLKYSIEMGRAMARIARDKPVGNLPRPLGGVVALTALCVWPLAAGAAVLDPVVDPGVEVRSVATAANPPTANGARRRAGSARITRPLLDLDFSAREVGSPMRYAPKIMLFSHSDWRDGFDRLRLTTNQLGLDSNMGGGASGSRPSRSGLPEAGANDGAKDDPTIRDLLRGAVNGRRSSSQLAGPRPPYDPIQAAERQESRANGGDGGILFGLDLMGGLLDLSADSVVGQLILSAFEPSLKEDGTVTFSVLGQGNYMAEAKPGGGKFQVIDLASGKSILSTPQELAYQEQRSGGRPKKMTVISVQDLIWSLTRDLIRTPIFYLILLALLGWAVYTRAKVADG